MYRRLIAAACVLMLLPAPGAAAARARVDREPLRTVTLVTGDRVRVTVDGEQVSLAGIVPGAGRTRIPFFSLRAGGHLRVVPADALPFLHAGRLDPRLFDVSALVGFGYHRRTDLPLIVTGEPLAAGRTADTAGTARAVPGGSAIRPAKTDLPALWSALAGGLSARPAGRSRVWLDGLRRTSLDASVPMIGAPAAWAAGYTGSGVTVAVVDTGIDDTHPDLAGRVVAAQDFTGAGNTLDQVGHGTHVAATIASNHGRYRGVAPDVRLLSAKVCTDPFCPESAILAGMQWAAEQRAKVVNMSLGGGDTPEQDPLEAAVEDLTARFGVLFVIAAGNSGGEQSVESPGSADSALTVGALDKAGALAPFSSRGPRIGDFAIKPDITAPGVEIVAARSKDGLLGNPGESHLPLSGTSMATPHVAGAAAILAQQHPTWTPGQLKAALMGSATASDIDVYAQGAGRLDVARAITGTLVADPPSLSYGRQWWPHTDDEPDTRTVTYRNLGSAAVTLNLSLTGGAPAGLFTLSASTLTVPAGGTASVALTSDTRVAVPDARYAGQLVAQAGPARVTTPFAVDKEVESYTVTLHHLDRRGEPTENFFTGLIDPGTGTVLEPVADGATVRVPAGSYAAISGIFGPDTAATMLLETETRIDRDVTITMDARHGRPVSVSVPLPGATPQFVAAVGDVATPIGNLTGVVFGDPENTLYVGSAHPDRRSPAIHSLIAGQYTRDGADPLDSPYLAQVLWREPGRMFPGFTKRLRPSDLAAVHAEHAADRPTDGFLQLSPVWPEGWTAPISPGSPVAVPGARVEYYNTDEGVSWIRRLFLTDVEDPALGTVLVSLRTRFEGGRQYREKRNVAVYGPGFSHTDAPQGWISRHRDTFTLQPTLVNDQLNWYGVLQGTDSQRITLDRNGTRVFTGTDFGTVDVAPGTARYRLGVELTRPDASLSISVSCVWTFRSGTVHSRQGVPLPLSVVRFLPRLDDRNTAPAGRLWAVPVQVQRQQRSAAGPVATLTVEVSYDDGGTWRPVPVIRQGQDGVALLNHPAGPGFVSLRASSTDTAGNTVQETIIRAYRLG